VVVRVDVPIPGLPPAWQGFTVAQISDIHVGPTIRQRYVRRIVERVNTPASVGNAVGVHPPGDRLLGAAEPVWLAFGNYLFAAAGGLSFLVELPVCACWVWVFSYQFFCFFSL